MKKKTGIVISSAAAIAVCASVMAGSTYALFTSESKTDIVVKSATVDVSARIDDIVANHSVWNAETGKYEATGEGLFSGETVSEVEGTLSLNYVAPGDLVKFNIYVENHSSIDVKYRVKMACTEGEELLNGLKLTVGGTDYSGLVSYVSEWQQWSGDNKIVPVVIELPVDAGNEYQGLSCKISYSVEAIQGNGATNNDDAKLIKTKVSSGTELKAALNYVKANGGEITLTNDVVAPNLPTMKFQKDTTINLNGHKLSADNGYFYTENGSQLTIKDGDLAMPQAKTSYQSIEVTTGSTLVMDNVTMETNGYGVFARGDAAKVDIKNCVFNLTGGAAVTTNAGNTDNYNVNINIEDTVITNTVYCGILINVPCTATISGCTVTGAHQGVIIRGGDVVIKDSVITSTSNLEEAKNVYLEQEWGTGSNVPHGALIVGNRHSKSYQYATNLTLTNTEVNVAEGSTVPVIYAYGNATEEIGTTLTYPASIGNVVIGGGCVKTNVVVSNTEEAQVALDNATDNCGIILKAGEYGKLILGPSAVCVADEKQIDYYSHHRLTRTVNNLSIVGEDGVVVDGFELKGTLFNNNPDNKTVFNPVLENYECFYMRYYITGINIENITFKDGIYLNSEGYETVELFDITIKNCSTTADGDHMANQPANKLADIRKAVNVTVENCVVTNRFQGVYLMGVENATVTGCHFENTVHNAIALQDFSASGTHCSGNLVITGNEFNGIGDRVIRFGGLDNAAVVIKNNTIGANCGDADGELSKLASYTENTTFELVNNGDGFVIVGYNN